MCDSRPKRPAASSSRGTLGEDPVALRQRDGYERAKLGRLGGYCIHLARIDPHGLLHPERIALVEQIMGSGGHLSMPPKRQNKVGPARRSIVRWSVKVSGFPTSAARFATRPASGSWIATSSTSGMATR